MELNSWEIWFIYIGVTLALALISFLIPDKSKGILAGLKTATSILFVLIGITVSVWTLAVVAGFVINTVAPGLGDNWSSSDSSSEENCVPDHYGGC